MQAKAQVIPFDEDRMASQGVVRTRPRRRPVPPGGAEVIVFRPTRAEAGEEPPTSLPAAARAASRTWHRALVGEESGQGTTEYAILVGVLVVIAIMAILIFRDKVQELWNAIADGINSL